MKRLVVLLLITLSPTVFGETLVPGKVQPGEKEFLGCNKYPPDKKFRWGVRGEVGVPELVASLAEISCRPIVVSPGAAARAGKVSLEVPDLLTTTEVYRLFFSSLEVLGLTVEESGRTLKIVDVHRAREVARPDLEGPGAAGDQFVVRLYHVERADVSQLAEALARMKSKDGDVSPYPSGGAIIITDRATNAQRIEEMARALDVAPPGQRIFTLSTHAQAPSELAATIDKIMQAGHKPSAKDPPAVDGVSAVVPVDGARLLAVVATDAGYRRVAALAQRIDPPVFSDGGVEDAGTQAHVIYLANTNAEDLAQTLQQVGINGKQKNGMLQGEVKIAPDKVSNSLVVFAGAADFPMVRDLVMRLDVPRRQVYVEALILDLSVDKLRNLGLAFHSGTAFNTDAQGNSDTGFVMNGSSSLNSAVINAQSIASMASGGGLLAGVFGKAFSFAGMSIPSFGVILQALEHSKDVNVLSRPHLLTMDNTKASLTVGQKIPFAAQALTTATVAAAGAVATTYQRVDVALKLEITPHLNDSDSVRLEIDGDIEDVPDQQTAGQAGGPTTNQRAIKTAVVVKDGETVVLGGLQKDTQSETVDKIPGLGDIPILGRLFQSRSKQHTKQDLLIVLTPYVIRGPDDLRRIYQQRESEREEFLERCSAFADESAFEQHIDYRRKRGLLEEINLAGADAERQAEAFRAAQKQLRRSAPDGPIAE